MLTTKQESLALMLFKEFFRRCPDQKNPTDPNTQEKYNYIVEIGWESLRLMQQARKANTQQNGYPYPWTKADYWQKSSCFETLRLAALRGTPQGDATVSCPKCGSIDVAPTIPLGYVCHACRYTWSPEVLVPEIRTQKKRK